MSTSKLTNMIRDQIIGKAIAATFDKEHQEISVAKAELAERCYNHIVPLDVRKLIAKLPEGWLRLDKCLRFHINGLYISLGHPKGLPVKYSNGCGVVGSIVDDVLRDDVIELNKREEAFNASKSKAYKALQQMIYGITTFKQLKATWPEGEKFYSSLQPKTESSNLPAIMVDDVNAMLGLNASKKVKK